MTQTQDSRRGSSDAESGYESNGISSNSTSVESLQTIFFTVPHLKHINAQLAQLEPEGAFQLVYCQDI